MNTSLFRKGSITIFLFHLLTVLFLVSIHHSHHTTIATRSITCGHAHPHTAVFQPLKKYDANFDLLEHQLATTSSVNCNLYDKVVSAYHGTVAVNGNEDGYLIWGEGAGSQSNYNVLSPIDLAPNTSNPQVNERYAYTGTILKAAVGSDEQHQYFALTTTGLWVWGDDGRVISTSIKSGYVMSQISMPSGVAPTDVASLIASKSVLAILTNSGQVWILSRDDPELYGNGSTSINHAWHQVEVSTGGVLTNVEHLRVTAQGGFAVTSNGNFYTWGDDTYLGNGTAKASRSKATLMTKPFTGTLKMIALSSYSSSEIAYFALDASNGEVYALGTNTFGLLGINSSVSNATSWTKVKSASGSGTLTNIIFINSDDSDAKYPAAGAIDGNGRLYLWGSNDQERIGFGATSYITYPSTPPSFNIGTDNAAYLEIGGHTTMAFLTNQSGYCYVGHAIEGSFGDGSSTDKQVSSFSCIPVSHSGGLCANIDCSTGTDTDGDGVVDDCDDDDDNDGILDVDECPLPTNSGLTGPMITFTATITSDDLNSINEEHYLDAITLLGNTYTDFITPDGYTSNFIPAGSGAAVKIVQSNSLFNSSSPTFDQDILSTFQTRDLNTYQGLSTGHDYTDDSYDLFYNNPVISTAGGFVMVVERHGNNEHALQALDENGNLIGSQVLVQTSNYVDVGATLIYSQHAHIAVYPVDDLVPVGTEIHGLRVSFGSLSTNDGPDGKVFFFGDVALAQCDYDGDGIPNHLDLDSDNDGCPDAIEGGGSFGVANLDNNDRLTGSVDADGIPIIASTGQTVGSSQNENINACPEICNDNMDNDGDGLVDCADPDCPACNLDCNDGVTLLSIKTDTKIGLGASNIPSISNLAIPSGNNRAVFIIASFEREHCQSGDDCTNANTAGVGLGDNFASPTFLAGPVQITANFSGTGGSVSYKNPLGSPDGDLRFGYQTRYPTPPNPNNSASTYSQESYYIAIYESDIDNILGGNASGQINITLPDVNTPLDNADEAVLYAFVFDNVEESNFGIVRSGSLVQLTLPGNFTLTDSDLDNGQEPDEEEDGILVFGMSSLGASNNGGFNPISSYTEIGQEILANPVGDHTDNNEPDGMSTSVFFRNGPASGIIDAVSIQSSGLASVQAHGAILAVFTIESCSGVEDCTNGQDDDGDGLIDCADTDCKPIISNINTIAPSCANKTGGQITITASGSGTLSYSITNETSWQTSNTFSGLGAGQYIIRVKNDSGCETEYSNNPVIFDLGNCPEICNDGIDNDGDGLIDCNDPDCTPVGTSNQINN